MRSKADVLICLDGGKGEFSFTCALAAHTRPWANWVSLLSGRYASAHGVLGRGDPIRAWTKLPELFQEAGYTCRVYGDGALPFEWERRSLAEFAEKSDAPELAVVFGPAARSGAWVIHLGMPGGELRPEAGMTLPMALTPPEGAMRDWLRHGSPVFSLPISLTDLLPSLCGLLGLAIPPDVQGRNLMPLFEREALARRELAVGFAETEEGCLIWDGARGVLLDAQGAWRLDTNGRQGMETDEALLTALGAAMLRAQDTLPIPQRRYRVKRHPANLWFDEQYRQRQDPGVIKREQPRMGHQRVAPVKWEG